MSAAKDKRCSWCLGSELYQQYHDTEWGIPCYEERDLFEMLNLEGAQAGLSWITILNKRENYRRLFADFDVVKMARFTDARQSKLMNDAGIVRHQQKIAAFVNNAKIVVQMNKQGESLADYLWSFVNYSVTQNQFSSMSQLPAWTDTSDKMSKALKKRGFKFLGRTTCYAFMQASGMTNDHLVSCPAHATVSKLIAKQTGRPKHWS